MRKLRGKAVKITHGLADSPAQLEPETRESKRQTVDFIDACEPPCVRGWPLGRGPCRYERRDAGPWLGSRPLVRALCETTGETDDYGLPVRYAWASEYRGKAMVVYGHTPVAEPEWLNRTTDIDTGCVFGGKTTALRYPEKELVSVPAIREYYAPSKPFLQEGTLAEFHPHLGSHRHLGQRSCRPAGRLRCKDRRLFRANEPAQRVLWHLLFRGGDWHQQDP